MCILLSFSLSLVIHDSEPKGKDSCMIPKFLKQRFKIHTCFVSMIHDSWFRFHTRIKVSFTPGNVSFMMFPDKLLTTSPGLKTNCPYDKSSSVKYEMLYKRALWQDVPEMKKHVWNLYFTKIIIMFSCFTLRLQLYDMHHQRFNWGNLVGLREFGGSNVAEREERWTCKASVNLK